MKFLRKDVTTSYISFKFDTQVVKLQILGRGIFYYQGICSLV